jgi:hypothetical protein
MGKQANKGADLFPMTNQSPNGPEAEYGCKEIGNEFNCFAKIIHLLVII